LVIGSALGRYQAAWCLLKPNDLWSLGSSAGPRDPLAARLIRPW